jgi:quinoprotein glucose dehydrogenase
MVITDTMLIYGNVTSDGTPHIFALDKATGEELARVEAPATSRYGMSSWVHEGRQYVILQTGSTLTAMALPGEDQATESH